MLVASAPPPVVAPALDRMSNLLFDQYQRWKPRDYEDAGVVVVDIDEETIRRFGQWPWPRTDIAALNDRLSDAGAAVVAYDIVFSEADRTSPSALARRLGVDPAARATLSRLPDNDAALAASFARGRVVAGQFLTHERYGRMATPKAGFATGGTPPSQVATFNDVVPPLLPLDTAAAGTGFVSIAPDSDAIVRKAPLVAKVGDQLLPSLSLEALRVAQGAGAIILKTSDGSGEWGSRSGDMVSLKVGAFEVPTTRQGELWVHYTRPAPQRIIPAWQVLSDQLVGPALASRVEGRIVFVGAGAIGLRDLIATPISDRDLGVMVHAQAAEQMILGQFLVRPDWAKGLELALALVLGLGLAVFLPRLGALRGALLGAAAIALLSAGSWWAFSAHYFLLDPVWPALAIAAAWGVETIVSFYREERQRAYIHQAFDRYLSPEMVRRIADDPASLELGGVERDMSVLFCDIRGFSRLSERMAPNEVIDFLVRFLTPMSDVLMAHGATIDKYIGDAILAFWNAPLEDPDHHRHAALAALTMQRDLKALNEAMIARGDGSWPGDVRIGVGLNSGPCCVGNIGSQQRLSYSLIGDPVNLASRIEGLTKFYQVEILCGSGLAQKLDDFALVPVDRVRVVGRDAPEMLSALLGDASVKSDPRFTAFAARHRSMLDAYFARQFDEAAAINDSNEGEAASFGLTGLILIYRERLLAFAANPPSADWDGVFEATSK